MKQLNVGIVGLGTVGSGVAKILLEQQARMTLQAGRELHVKTIVARDLKKDRGVVIPPGVLTDDINAVINDPEIELVAQVIGGLEPARSIMLDLLKNGKDVVTANKALLAEHGAELFESAREHGRTIAFEAAVAGGIPIIAGIGQCLTANQITSLTGILNGTSNFIVSQMEKRGAGYGDALLEAQQRGFAEADPTMDVDGTDAAQKLAILSQIAYGIPLDWQAIPRIGINQLEIEDIVFARELGYRIKLLAVARLADETLDGGLDVHVSPTLVRSGTALSDVSEANNAVRVVGDAVGPVFFQGAGAGQMPTASAVVADLIDMAIGRAPLTFSTLSLWSDRVAPVQLRDPALTPSRYYVRLSVDDHAGVLADVTGILGSEDISIASMIQHVPSGKVVPVVIMTHEAPEGAMARATQKIDSLASVVGPSVRLRVAG